MKVLAFDVEPASEIGLFLVRFLVLKQYALVFLQFDAHDLSPFLLIDVREPLIPDQSPVRCGNDSGAAPKPRKDIVQARPVRFPALLFRTGDLPLFFGADAVFAGLVPGSFSMCRQSGYPEHPRKGPYFPLTRRRTPFRHFGQRFPSIGIWTFFFSAESISRLTWPSISL